MADQLWLMTRIREEELSKCDCDYIGNSTHKRKIICNLLNSAMTNEFVTMKIIAATANISKFNISKNVVCHNVDSVLESA